MMRSLQRFGVVVLAAWGLILSPPSAVLAQTSAARMTPPARGEIVPGFETLGIDGKAHKVSFPKGSKTVLLFFMSGCPHCHKMIPEWNRAYERRPPGLTVLGVIMDQEPPGFWSTLAVSFPVVRSPGRDFIRQIGITRAPLVLRVGEGGRIEDVAPGATDLIRLGEIFRP